MKSSTFEEKKNNLIITVKVTKPHYWDIQSCQCQWWKSFVRILKDINTILWNSSSYEKRTPWVLKRRTNMEVQKVEGNLRVSVKLQEISESEMEGSVVGGTKDWRWLKRWSKPEKLTRKKTRSKGTRIIYGLESKMDKFRPNDVRQHVMCNDF